MELSNDIISFLFTEGRVNLPGLGLFTLNKTTAKRNAIKNKVYGPKFSVVYNDSDINSRLNKKFIGFIANKYSKSSDKAEKQIQKYSLEILNNLANYNSAQITNFGTLSRNNELIEFEFSPIFKEMLQKSYPDLPLLLISREKETKSSILQSSSNSQNQTPITSNRNSNKKGWLFPFIILTLISIIFVCFMICISNLFDNDQQKGNLIIQDSTISSTQNIINDKDSTNTDQIFAQLSEDSINNNNIANSIDSSKIKSIVDTNENLNTQQLQEKTITDTTFEDNSDSNKFQNLDIISLTELTEMAPELRTQFDKTCIIIVGSFVRKKNADRMIKKMIKANFTPYSETYGSFHRTGVVFDCNEKPLLEFLDDLRQSVDKGSWVLKYR